MPSPTSSLATQRPDLSASLEEFDAAMDRQGFIGQRVLPIFDVAVQAGNMGRIPIEQLLMNAFGGKASLANKISASRKIFCN